MSVNEPTRAQNLTAEALALRWSSVRVDPTPDDDGNIIVTVTSRPTLEKRGGYTARATRQFDLLIAPDGEILTGVLS